MILTFSEYCQFYLNRGDFDISLSETDFVRRCKERFGISGTMASDYRVEHGIYQCDFVYEQKIDGQIVTMFKGTYKELYHLLRQSYGVEDKQLTLW